MSVFRSRYVWHLLFPFSPQTSVLACAPGQLGSAVARRHPDAPGGMRPQHDAAQGGMAMGRCSGVGSSEGGTSRVHECHALRRGS